MERLSTRILGQHAETLRGSLRRHLWPSPALGFRNALYVYQSPGASAAARVPLVCLLRGHEREFVHLREDGSRFRTTIEMIEADVLAGTLPPLVAVMPGLNTADNTIPSLGVDMAGTWPARAHGLGTGRYWQYLAEELLPSVELHYPETQGGQRLVAGFSLGGYTAGLLAAKKPGLFDHVAAYDGLHMWAGLRDPRTPDRPLSDRVWTTHPIFDAAFGSPRNEATMHRFNPTDVFAHTRGDGSALHAPPLPPRTATHTTTHSTTHHVPTYHIASAAHDGMRGNRDRNLHFVDHLKRACCSLSFNHVIYHPDAAHTWHWMDRFTRDVLREALAV